MYELIHVALIFGVAHVVFVWAAVDGLGLTYTQLLAANLVSGMLSAVFAKQLYATWRDRLLRAMRLEAADGELAVDLLLALGIFAVTGVISAVIIARRFG